MIKDMLIYILTNLKLSNYIRKYRNKLKQRVKDEGNETVTNCNGLKLKSKDGKDRMTDVTDIQKY